MNHEQEATIDSGIESNYTSDMESINSQNYAFRFKGHRRYHGVIDNPYPLPNDDQELIRLDELQYVMRSNWRRNVLAPIIRTPSKILDVGTGSGRWAIEVAEEFSSAQVIGMDLSPIQPTDVPVNCEFVVGDLTSELDDFDDGHFDLVHSRIIMGGVKDWDTYIKDVYRLLKPGTGYAQISEMTFPRWNDDSVPEDSNYARFVKLHEEGHAKRGTIMGGAHLEPRFHAAGFVDIKVNVKEITVGDWRGSRKGASVRRSAGNVIFNAIPFLAMQFEDAIPDFEERQRFGELTQAECRNANYHVFSVMHMVTARKPVALLDV
jgi:SAM-dependent methyltransferase